MRRLIVLIGLLLACAFAAPAEAQLVTQRAAVFAPPAPGVELLVANRNLFPDSVNGPANNWRSVSFKYCQVATTDFTNPRAAFVTFHLRNKYETGGDAQVEVSELALEYPTGAGRKPATFNKGAQGIIPQTPSSANNLNPAQGFLLSDPVPGVYITSGSTFCWWGRFNAANLGTPYLYQAAKGASDLVNFSATYKASSAVSYVGSITDNSSGYGAGPVATIGVPANPANYNAVIIVGDSISQDVSGSAFRDPEGQVGIIATNFPTSTLAFLNVASPSSRAVEWATWTNGRKNFYKYATGIVNELTVNDLGASTLASTIVAANQAIRGQFPLAERAVLTTVTPVVASTTNLYTTAAGQTSGWTSNYRDYNTAVRALPAGYTAYWDLANALLNDTGTQDGKWKIPASARTLTTDVGMASGGKVITSAGSFFASTDVGSAISVPGAKAGPNPYTGCVLAFTSAAAETIADNAPAAGANAGLTVTSQTVNMGSLTNDGLHPCPAGNIAAGAAITLSDVAP
jgi:hypothetical protein